MEIPSGTLIFEDPPIHKWDVDLTDATLSPTSMVRGWESMPAVVR